MKVRISRKKKLILTILKRKKENEKVISKKLKE